MKRFVSLLLCCALRLGLAACGSTGGEQQSESKTVVDLLGREVAVPEKVERILSEIVPKEEQSAYCHRMVLFGREYCMARSPRCEECPVMVCPKKGNGEER